MLSRCRFGQWVSILKRWGYSPQRPLKRAYEQDPAAIEQWLAEVYLAIERKAAAEGGEIHLSGRQRVRVNYIATVSNQGEVRFMRYTSSFTGPVYVQFLERLVRSSEHKLFLIADRHLVHLRKMVQRWFEAHSTQIEAFDLPSYSPQLNPVEYLNNDVKQQVHSQSPTRNLDQLKHRVSFSLRKIQKLPARVMNYFLHPDITYAAA